MRTQVFDLARAETAARDAQSIDEKRRTAAAEERRGIAARARGRETLLTSNSVRTHHEKKEARTRTMPSRLPPKPDFRAMEAAAHTSADRRTMILALIGNLVYSWSNNESLFIYVLMLLLRTSAPEAAITFATLNTTRARLDLIQRLAKARIHDSAIEKSLDQLIERFNECTRVRNEFNHCMYSLNERGEITHTNSMRIHESKGQLQFGNVRKMDAARIQEMTATIRELTALNRDIWDFLPRLEAHLEGTSPSGEGPRR